MPEDKELRKIKAQAQMLRDQLWATARDHKNDFELTAEKPSDEWDERDRLVANLAIRVVLGTLHIHKIPELSS